MIQQMSGPRYDGRDWPDYGAVIEVPDDEGRDLCAGGLAVPVAEERKVETAAPPPDPAVEVRAEPALAEGEAEPVKRGPGRPPGSTNKPK
jgi:hypothetical protein